ncbi:hypothetical protein SMKC041_45430 [Serratia marcescens]|nr:hypothetical protein SMKC041_45430 [Serratia marcescens]
MLPVARIAQSVEQGIENPRVLGSIPSPGTIFREPSLWLGFCFSGTGLSIELRSIIRPKASPYRPALKRCSTRRKRRLSESGRPIERTQPMAGFSLSGTGLSIELRSIIRPKASPYGPALKRCSTRRKRRLSESGRPIERTQPMAGFSLSGTGLSIELRSIIRPKASPYGPALKRCSTRRQRRLSESGRPIERTQPMAGFSLSGTGLSIELRSIIRPKASPYGPALKRCSTRRKRRLSESGHHIKKNPPMAGFSLSGTGLSIELRSIIRPKASPCGPALKRCSTRHQRRLSESGRPIERTRLWRVSLF